MTDASPRLDFKTLNAMRLVVTSGPTREWLDPVRFITNSSSGKTGHNLARVGLAIFREVVLISGPGDPRYRTLKGAKNVAVESTAELLTAVLGALESDTLLVMSAAPADYTPAEASEHKLKKSGDELVLRMKPTADVLLASRERAAALVNCVRVGFAAETQDLAKHAAGKLERKGLDYICANDVYRSARGFGENPNTWHVFDRSGGVVVLGPAEKDELARALFGFLEGSLAERGD